MAFTADEKLQIQHYLGLSSFYFLMNAEIIGVGADDAAATRVGAILADLADIDQRLKIALDNLTLTKAEDVEFRGEGELEALRNHGRNLIHRLAIIFGVETGADYYGNDISWTGAYEVP
jgi:hypothetical protein